MLLRQDTFPSPGREGVTWSGGGGKGKRCRARAVWAFANRVDGPPDCDMCDRNAVHQHKPPVPLQGTQISYSETRAEALASVPRSLQDHPCDAVQTCNAVQTEPPDLFRVPSSAAGADSGPGPVLPALSRSAEAGLRLGRAGLDPCGGEESGAMMEVWRRGWGDGSQGGADVAPPRCQASRRRAESSLRTPGARSGWDPKDRIDDLSLVDLSLVGLVPCWP